MPRRPRHDPTPAITSANWWATVQRDGHACRVAPFLPDLPCEGALTIYDPADLNDADPVPSTAVTICDGHLAWVRTNPAVAIALGLARG